MTSTFSVRGRVLRSTGAPVRGATVVAYDRDLRRRETLGACRTDHHGRYMIHYEPGAFLRGDVGRADLIVSVLDHHGNAVTESPTNFNADPNVTIDLTVDAENCRGLSEHEILVDSLRPLLRGVPPHELTAEDRAFLAAETGLDPEWLEGFAHAAALARSLRCDALGVVHFYGLWRQGLKAGLEDMLAVSPVRILRALDDAVAANQIPADAVKDPAAFVEALESAAERALLDHRRPGEASTLQEVLAAGAVREALAGAYVRERRRLGADRVWTALAEDPAFEAQEVAELRLTVDAAELTKSNEPLVARLHAERRSREQSDWIFLAERTRAEWTSLLTAEQIAPPEYFGEDIEAYGDWIAKRVEDRYPGAVLAERVAEAERLPLPRLGSVVQVLKASPRLDVLTSPLRSYFRENPDALAQVDEPDAVIADLEAMQRVRHTTKNADEAVAILEGGYRSASSIAAFDRDVFVATAKAMDPEAAGRVYDEASHRAALAQGILLEARDAFREPLPTAIGYATPPIEEVPAEWRRMFGAIDFCACEACRSVLGPAAYLVDLLEFLDVRAPMGGRSPQDVLSTRRPDIQHILLDCENAHTVVPYIDLVIEILERAVTGSAEPWPQTSAAPKSDAAARRLAEPEHLTEAAYAPLADAIYPWRLPFDLFLFASRAYLARLGVARSELLAHFGATAVAVAAEVLSLSPLEWQLVAGTSGYTPWAAWGEAGPSTQLSNVATFLARSEADFSDLEAWSRTRFVGALALDGRDTCDTAKMTIRGLDADRLDRVHRFVRLQRHLGWEAVTLDAAITVLGGGDLDQAFLFGLADAQRAMARLGWTPQQIVTFFAAAEPAEVAAQRSALASALRVSGEDFEVLSGLAGLNPLAGPSELVELAGAVDRLSAVSLSVSELSMLLDAPDAPDRLGDDEVATVLEELRRELRSAPASTRPSTIATMLAEASGQEISQLEELFARYPDLAIAFDDPAYFASDPAVPVSDAGVFAAVFAGYRRVHRIAYAVAALGLTATERADYLAALDAAGHIDFAGIMAFAGGLDRGVATESERLLEHLAEAGVDVATAEGWAANPPDSAMLRAIVDAVESTVLPEDWADVGKKIRDPIRERQAEALVAHLLTFAPPPGVSTAAWRTASDLYAHYLVDVQMSACALTSRIKLAHSSVQLFAQRCLLNLEADVRVDDTFDRGWTEWSWRKNYRVWEAARRIFLHPENWLDPTRRDDKTPAFATMENGLLQEELTDARATKVLRTYVESLANVSQLEITGAVAEQKGEDRITHMFGHTRGVPPEFFYRREIATPHGRRFTPWEEVTVDIDEPSFMIPVVWNGALVLVWPQFVERSRSTTIRLGEGETLPPSPPAIDMQIGWSRYEDGHWSEKRYFDATTSVLSRDEADVRLVAAEIDRDLRVREYPAGKTWHFDLRVPSPTSHPIVRYPTGEPARLPGTVAHGAGLLTHGRGLKLFPDFTQDLLRHPDTDSTRPTPSQFRLYVADGVGGAGPRPVVFQDEQRSFWIGEWSGDPELPPDLAAEVQRLLEIPIFGWIVAAALVMDYFDRLDFRYRVQPLYHPFAAALLAKIDRDGLSAALHRDVQRYPTSRLQVPYFGFVGYYDADIDRLLTPIPSETFEFAPDGAYTQYNWEIFVHASLRIAAALTQNQRFAEAQSWLHRVFDPTATTGPAGPARYWQARPFYELIAGGYQARIEDRLRAMSAGEDDELEAEIARWERDPTSPYAVARTRPLAYPKAVVMQYLDNLIAWADHLFTRYTIESNNEATQLYLLASEILGPRPQRVTASAPLQKASYATLKSDIDAFGNALVASAENLIGTGAYRELGTSLRIDRAFVPQRRILRHLLYFCVPHNDKLLDYWDTVADRLFKLRHCQDISGRVRPLALFEPRIDPALLARARRAGVDVRDALDPGPQRLQYRFEVVANRAEQLVQEVKGLGSALLAALEKRDAEGLALLSASQGQRVLELLRDNRVRQVDEAKATERSLHHARAAAQHRQETYRERETINAGEVAHLALLQQSIVLEEVAGGLDLAANIIQLIPDFKVGAPFTLGALFGGSNLGPALRAFAAFTRSQGSVLGTTARMSETLAGYQRRKEEWDLQEALASREMQQLDEQIGAAELRREMATHELSVHDQQRSDATATFEALRDKYTNQVLYDWMVSQISTVYFQAYQLAYGMAVRAEKALRYELGLADEDTAFIRPGYWDTLKKGLLAGDKLSHDVSRLRAYHLEQNARDLEITKHVSLAALDPRALVELIETGNAEVSVPELLFDLDFPGHYLRRIKSVGVTIPAVTGPYVGVPCSLTLVTSRTRVSPDTAGGYAPAGTDDPRFTTHRPGTEVIVTSTGLDDHGLFETDLRDARYLPFEGAGAVSVWRLALPQDYPPFDYRTIGDVVLHMRYTARAAEGDALASAARASARSALRSAAGAVGDTSLGLVQVVSARREFPDAWHVFERAVSAGDSATLAVELGAHQFPHFVRGESLLGRSVLVVWLGSAAGAAPSAQLTGPDDATPHPLTWQPVASAEPPPQTSHAASPALGADFGVRGDWRFELAAPSTVVPEDVLLIVRYRVGG